LLPFLLRSFFFSCFFLFSFAKKTRLGKKKGRPFCFAPFCFPSFLAKLKKTRLGKKKGQEEEQGEET
jgi:hypothetical protein